MKTFFLRYSDLIFAVALVIVTIFRGIYLEPWYPLFHRDVPNEYLVAHHIIADREIPLIGPGNSFYSTIINSPFYFHFLTFFLLLKDDIFFLGWVNLSLQILSSALLFLFVRLLFGRVTALLAGLFFLINPYISAQSWHMWQPYAMQPFLFGSYLSLAIAYQKKLSFSFIALSVLLFCFSLGFGLYSFTVLPFYIVIVFLLLRSNRLSFKSFSSLSLFCFAALSLFYGTVAFELARKNQLQFFLSEPVYILNLKSWILNFLQTARTVASNLFLSDDMFFLNTFVSIIIVWGFFLTLYQSSPKQRRFLTALALYSLQPFVLASFLKTPSMNVYHFTPVLGIFIIFIALSANTVLNRRYPIILKVLFFLALSTVISQNFRQVPEFLHPTFVDQQALKKTTVTLIKTIKNIHATEHKSNLRFFQLAVFDEQGQPTNYDDGIFWLSLEKAFAQSFIQIVNFRNNFIPLSQGNDYIFTICLRFTSLGPDYSCTKSIANRFPHYQPPAHLVTEGRYEMYLSKKR